ncbi:hypothetical protein ACOMHN_044350 [Nucella lapillus]
MLVGEEATQNQNLADADQDDDDRFPDRPEQHALVDVFRKGSTLSLAKSEVSLKVKDSFQLLEHVDCRVFDLHREHTQLSRKKKVKVYIMGV